MINCFYSLTFYDLLCAYVGISLWLGGSRLMSIAALSTIFYSKGVTNIDKPTKSLSQHDAATDHGVHSICQ